MRRGTWLMVWGALAIVVGCGSSGGGIGTPGFQFRVGGTLVGTGPHDIWWWAPNAQFGTSGEYRSVLWRYDGGWTEVGVPEQMRAEAGPYAAQVVAAGPGEVWFVRSQEGGTVTVIRLDASGRVIEDRSSEIPPFDGVAGLVTAGGGSNGAFVGTPLATGAYRWYALSRESPFTVLSPPGTAGFVASAPGVAYFTVAADPPAPSGLYTYVDGTWAPAGMDIGASGDFVLPTSPDEAWIAPSNPTGLTVRHRQGSSWTTIPVTGYPLDDTGDNTAGLSPLAWGTTADGELAVLSTWYEPAQGFGDWAERGYVTGTIGIDGAYRDGGFLVSKEDCDPNCYNTLTFFDGGNPSRLDDGSMVLDQLGQDEPDVPAAHRNLIVWSP